MAVLVYVVRDVARFSWDQDWAAVSPAFLVLALGVFLAIPVMGGLRWWVVLRGIGYRAAPGALITLFSVTTVLGQVMPLMAGDGLRGLLAIQRGHPSRVTFHAILLERGIMILTLLGLVLMTQPFVARPIEAFGMGWIAAFLFAMGCGGLGLLIVAGRAKLMRRNLLQPLTMLAADTDRLFTSRWGAMAVLGGLLSNLNFIAAAALLACALNVPVSFLDCLIVVPMATVATTLPVSFGGWGVREGVFVAVLGTMGVPAAAALMLSLGFGLCGALSGLPGFLMWRLGREAAGRTAPDAQVSS